MSEKIKIGIVGIGRAGWGMHTSEIAKFEDLYEVVAACDTEQERVDKMVEKYDNCKGYTSIEEFLKDPNMKVVSVATRSPEHPTHAKLALEAGKYVFLEKPVAINAEGAELIKELDAKYPGKLFFRHNRRFEPAFQHISEIIDSGILGDVYEIKLCRHGYQRRDDWQTIVECGGGQLNNWGPHLIDHALQFIKSPVKNIWSDIKNIACAGDAEDHLKIIIQGESDIVVDIEISGGVALGSPVYAVYGTKGALVCEDEQDIKLNYIDPKAELSEITAKKESPSLEASFGNVEEIPWRRSTIMVEPATKCETHDIWKHLYEAIENGVQFPISTEEALNVVKVTNEVKSGTKFEVK